VMHVADGHHEFSHSSRDSRGLAGPA
jgi:hypothetical protein